MSIPVRTRRPFTWGGLVRKQETGRTMRDVSGEPGQKYDHLKLLDLDEAGDLDILTCEERDQLGVRSDLVGESSVRTM